MRLGTIYMEMCTNVSSFTPGSDHILGKASASTKRLLHRTLQHAWGTNIYFICTSDCATVSNILLNSLSKKVFLGALFFIFFRSSSHTFNHIHHIFFLISLLIYTFLCWFLSSFFMIFFNMHRVWNAHSTVNCLNEKWFESRKEEGRFSTYHIFPIPRLKSSSWRTLNAWAKTQTLHIMKW